jgi:hypothetical protein
MCPLGHLLTNSSRHPIVQLVKYGEGTDMDLTGIAAVGGVVIAAASAASGALVSRGRMQRLERLVAIRGMVADQARAMDYRQRGPKTTWEMLGGLLAEACGWFLALLAYILFWVSIRDMQPAEPVKPQEQGNPWPVVIGLLLGGIALIFAGLSLRNGLRKTRDRWIRNHSPEKSKKSQKSKKLEGPRSPEGLDKPEVPEKREIPEKPGNSGEPSLGRRSQGAL